ncbi:MAG: hypothetical protein J6D27_05445 [Ruminiclostridium sp.]|nr:hypothetical protein [Ruminiclostridium sp.]
MKSSRNILSIMITVVFAISYLTACHDNNTSEISSDTSSDIKSFVVENSESREESSNNNTDSGHQITGSPIESLIEDYYSNYSEPEKPREPTFRYAKEKDKISKETDYDAIVSICTDLYYEYGRLTAGKDAVLTGITDNENFKIYLTYMAQHSDSVEYTATPYLDNVEMTDYPEYNCVFVKATKTRLGGGGALGEACYIVTVKGDRLYVADYNTQFTLYNEAYRKNFSAEENHDFWDNPEKYQSILDITKNNP